jgi:hypothetical protein
MPGYHRLRLPASYQALLNMDARGLAWEWLRRNGDFRMLWSSAGLSARRASTLALAAVQRSARPIADIARHPLARRLAPWGLTFRGRS